MSENSALSQPRWHPGLNNIQKIAIEEDDASLHVSFDLDAVRQARRALAHDIALYRFNSSLHRHVHRPVTGIGGTANNAFAFEPWFDYSQHASPPTWGMFAAKYKDVGTYKICFAADGVVHLDTGLAVAPGNYFVPMAAPLDFTKVAVDVVARNRDLPTPDTYTTDDGGLVLDFALGDENRLACVLRPSYAHIMAFVHGEFSESTLSDSEFAVDIISETLQALAVKAGHD